MLWAVVVSCTHLCAWERDRQQASSSSQSKHRSETGEFQMIDQVAERERERDLIWLSVDRQHWLCPIIKKKKNYFRGRCVPAVSWPCLKRKEKICWTPDKHTCSRVPDTDMRWLKPLKGQITSMSTSYGIFLNNYKT